MQFNPPSDLPIFEVLAPLQKVLADHDEAVLQAPPGAGKTTIVPLELLGASWLEGRKILVLEPRRVAARAAASRMADLLGERVGQTVGYRIRLDTSVSESTRIEVITEGILTRMLQRDPGLDGVGLVIFDEFHERNLDSDLCLALCLQGRELFREGAALKLLVMSATLDGEAVSRIMGDAVVLTSEGRQYPVETRFNGAHQLRDSIVSPTVEVVSRVVAEHEGNVLVFLPGQREIQAVARELTAVLAHLGHAGVQVLPLFGGMPLERQQQAIEAPDAGQRKVVLATNVAETSLTIEGVNVVVDSGLARQAKFDPNNGMTRLTTQRISRASAEQRQGRAGRLGPGVCYRLWSEQQQDRLIAHTSPEILQADLAPLALQLLSWGVSDPTELAWLDPPPMAAWGQAMSVLERCGAAFRNDTGACQLTPHGVRLAQMPLHPRLAHMLLVGCDTHATETACLMAALLSERNPFASEGTDIHATLAVLMGEVACPVRHQGWFRRIWDQARHFARLASEVHKPRKFALDILEEDVVGVLLASAYPDRIAMLRPGSDGRDYQLSNGRGAQLPANDSLTNEPWLSVAEVGGTVGEAADRIYAAVPLNSECFTGLLSALVTEEDHVDWDYRYDRFVAERRNRIGSLLLSTETLTRVPDAARQQALLGLVRKKGLGVLPWTQGLQQWRARIALLHTAFSDAQGGTTERSSAEGSPWPDLSDEALLASLEIWLAPYLSDVQRIEDFRKLDLKNILRALLPWPLPLELERLVPERWAVPSGSSIAIDYMQDPPVLAVKLQEMFGCEETPRIADGRVSLQVHLLSPAGRPLQITQDLAGFWRGAYQDVKREMKGRYPKHPWPDDPLGAEATARSNRRRNAS